MKNKYGCIDVSFRVPHGFLGSWTYFRLEHYHDSIEHFMGVEFNMGHLRSMVFIVLHPWRIQHSTLNAHIFVVLGNQELGTSGPDAWYFPFYYSSNGLGSVVLTSNIVWSGGIPAPGVFILKSTVGLVNTTHRLSDITSFHLKCEFCKHLRTNLNA